MVVMILESVTPSARGELTRWLIEPHPGVFVGHVSGMVRDKLWEKCCKDLKKGALIQMWTTNNEQRFQMRTYGATKREVIAINGLQLVRLPP
jgi:CRISPR-associated protein Cas2